MNRRVRIVGFVASAIVVAAFLAWGVAGLPAFGHYQGGYGNQLNREVLPERHTTNVVGAIVFDYRGFDTLGEEFILLTAVMGVTLLLRRGDEEEDEEKMKRLGAHDHVRSDAVRVVGLFLAPAILILGLWLVAYGYITPGGGFQGGVVIAGAIFLAYLCGGFRELKDLAPIHVLDLTEGTAAAAYTVFGLVGLAAGGAYLHNFLGPGERGTLYSGGSIALLNWASAIEVAMAMVILFTEFVKEYLLPDLRQRH
jgi:multicomponent Na+:H+ antiporter subunit B